ncbi:hypothetical protein ACTJKE_10490 [Ensifer sp. 22521]|uniref:hypothetical protein n=1 Tax=Ensifer sp. 22521 TaxID=3453935 RepID=UPI003F85C2C0
MVELAATIFSDGPSSNPDQPMKPRIREWGTWLEQVISAFTSGAGNILKTSRAALFADLAHAADTTAWVLGDPTIAYNGIYVKFGASGSGSWTRVSDLPFSFIIADDAGAGTPNAIQATTSIPVSSSALIWMEVADTNTSSPVTASFNGGVALTVKTNTGNNVAAGGLVSGMIVLGIVSGSTFRLFNDQISSAIVAAAEAAQAAAEAAAASINQRIYTAVASAAVDTIPAIVKRLRTQFFAPSYVVPATLVGGANYRRISWADLSTYPAPSYFRSTDRFLPDGSTDSLNGGYWVLDERTVNVSMLGAVGDAGIGGTIATNDAAAFQAASDFLGKAFGGGTITFSKRHLIASNVLLGKHVRLQGPAGRADPGNPFSFLPPIWAAMQAMAALIIDPAASISLESGGGIEGVMAFRRGIKLDGTDLATNFAGTAFKMHIVDGTYVISSSVVGFEEAFHCTENSRVKFDDVLIDCNNGIYCENSGDINRYLRVHCYPVTQGGVTGHETISHRSGKAFYFTGNSTGGPTIDNCFMYAFAIGIYLAAPGSYTISNTWIDGTTDLTTGEPLDPDRVGLILESETAPNAEPQVSNIKICSQGTAIDLREGNYGAMLLSNLVLFQNNVGCKVSGTDLNIVNLVCRSYFANGIIFNNVEAANTAKIVNATFYARLGSALDINGGAGDPKLVNCSYSGGILNVENVSRVTTAPVSEALTIPYGKDSVRVTGTGNIGDVLPKYDNYLVTLEFVSGGSQLLGGNFRLSAAFTASAGSAITLRRNGALDKWVEMSRSV